MNAQSAPKSEDCADAVQELFNQAYGQVVSNAPNPPCVTVLYEEGDGPEIQSYRTQSDGTKDWEPVPNTRTMVNWTTQSPPDPNGCVTIRVWPDNTIARAKRELGVADGANFDICSPEGLAFLYRLMLHEMLHELCGKHSDKTPGFDPGKGMPAPEPKDCGDVNFQVQTATEMLDTICTIIDNAAMSPPIFGPNPTGMDDCFSTANWCAALVADYMEQQMKANTPKNAMLVEGCLCGTVDENGMMVPPHSFPPGCPPLEFPPKDPADPEGPKKDCDDKPLFPDSKIIPDIPASKICPGC